MLVSWYKSNKRDLPWRHTRDPYNIWLSEIILQQTRVDQGTPYYLKFIEKYPTVSILAAAPIDDILRTWQGLGYYSRARNLHKCANIIVDKYNGVFPSNRQELIKLPGIGPYTSAAIASIAFGKREAVIDGNVVRVITRLFGIEEDIGERKTSIIIEKIAEELISNIRPDIFNQAIMEFGALHCKPKNPSCHTCDFIGLCSAQKNGTQQTIPFKAKKIKIRTRYLHYLILEINNKYFLRKRVGQDIWKGLFEFFLIEVDAENSFDQLEFPEIMIENSQKWEIVNESIIYKHQLTHQKIICKFYNIKLDENFKINPMDWQGYQLHSKEEIERLPKSILIVKYLEEMNY